MFVFPIQYPHKVIFSVKFRRAIIASPSNLFSVVITVSPTRASVTSYNFYMCYSCIPYRYSHKVIVRVKSRRTTIASQSKCFLVTMVVITYVFQLRMCCFYFIFVYSFIPFQQQHKMMVLNSQTNVLISVISSKLFMT